MLAASAELLERAKGIYLAADRDYRDRLLEAGGLLHEYVLAHLQEGVGLSEKERRKGKHTRAEAILKAARAMKTVPTRVNGLIGAAMTVRLLLGEEPVGGLGHRAILYFTVFVTRRVEGMANKHRKAGDDATEPEQWCLVADREEDGRRLIRQAVQEGWSQQRTRRELKPYFGKRSTVQGQTQRPGVFPVAVAPSGDVAEYLIGLLEQSQNPREVAAILQGKLHAWRPRAWAV